MGVGHSMTVQAADPLPYLLVVASLAAVTGSKDMKSSRPVLPVYQ